MNFMLAVSRLSQVFLRRDINIHFLRLVINLVKIIIKYFPKKINHANKNCHINRKKNINVIYRFDGTIKDNLYNRINDK